MAATSEDKVLLLYAPDSEKWAKFMSSRLAAPQYNITCTSQDVTSTSMKSPDKKPAVAPRAGTKDINDNENNKESSRDSGRASPPVDESVRVQDTTSNSRVSVIFLSPNILENDQPFSVDVKSLNSKKTVFLFLGVDIEEARRFFGDESDHVFKCRICIIDGSEISICDSLVQIIEACEDDGKEEDGDSKKDDGDIYNVPPSPKQLNRIEKVFPQELTETERDLHILLERPAEDEVVVILDTPKSHQITLTCVCERLYMFKVPAEVVGEVFFRVECQGVSFGEDSFQVHTKLDKLEAILKEEINPVSILASALGLKADDVEGVDMALAFRIQQLASAGTFKTMFPVEDALSNSDVHSNVRYPSLLHFAADLNLRTFCSQLLRYPGMLAAACTENKDGKFPSQMAARRGFTQLETELTQFVEDNKRVVDMEDTDTYILPSAMLPPGLPPAPAPPKPMPAPKPHTSSSSSSKSGYVNQPQRSEDNDNSNYISMDRHLFDRLRSKHRARSESSLFRKKLSEKKIHLHGKRSDSTLSPLTRSTQDDLTVTISKHSLDDGDNISEYQNMGDLGLSPSERGEGSESSSLNSPFESPRDGPADSSLSPDKYSASSSPGGTSRKALKMLGVGEEEITRSRSNTSDASQMSHTLSRLESQQSSESVFSDSVSPLARSYHGFGQMLASDDQRFSVSSNCDDPALLEPHGHGPVAKKNAMTNKIKNFFGKGKKTKRSASDGEASFPPGIGLKKSSSNRSARGSQTSIQSASRKKKTLASDTQEPQERDSGSYSDEEKEKASPLPTKRSSKNKVFKESKRPMRRKPSQRAQLAMSERIDNAPTLPSTSNKRKGAFKSFIETPE